MFDLCLQNSCEQNQEESVDNYVTRLRKLASSCEFGTLTEKFIRDRLVIGLIDTATKENLLRKKSHTLDKAIDNARANKITSKQLESINSGTTGPLKEDVNLVAKGKSRGFKKQPNRKSEKKVNEEKIVPLLEIGSARTVVLYTNETNARSTTQKGVTVTNGIILLVCVCPRRKMRSNSYKKAMTAQIQKNQFSKWKIFRPWSLVVSSASTVNKTS